ncbi:zinc-dependent alcohol dehydrogenase family protein [Halobellus marinus]|uniref:zinc-dependent alcohol dehydrogenase family protein n=1 Tax=Halobellus TaxID=1073986 RepID=UPI0028AFFB9C|nr:zinc-dependent alcohol dehydrogenase family protein [Halobellus sp. DFY28]
MRAAVLKEYGEPLVLEQRPELEPDDDGVVVRTEACGICRSDWHAWQGHGAWIDSQVPTDFVLGHEPAGTVVAVGEEVDTLTTGDQVVVPFNLGCGTCAYCTSDRANVCPNRQAIGFSPGIPGAFAESFHVPTADFNVVRLPEDVSPTEMAALGCRFVTAYHALAHRVDLTPGDWVAVHGCGGVGLSAVQLADALGARAVAIDIDEQTLSLASDLGAAALVDASENEDVPSAIRDVTNGGADVSIDALGVAETCRNSVQCLDRTGQHVQIGLTTESEAGEISLPIDRITAQELNLVGSYGIPPTQYDELFGLLEAGAIDPGALVTDHVALDTVPDRLAAMGAYDNVGVEVVTEF